MLLPAIAKVTSMIANGAINFTVDSKTLIAEAATPRFSGKLTHKKVAMVLQKKLLPYLEMWNKMCNNKMLMY